LVEKSTVKRKWHQCLQQAENEVVLQKGENHNAL